jgi:hypothetical protein
VGCEGGGYPGGIHRADKTEIGVGAIVGVTRMGRCEMNNYVPVETKRAIVAEMADWLEGRRFGVTCAADADMEVAKVAAASWAEGYRRAIHELRWAAQEPIQVPDDISELDSAC